MRLRRGITLVETMVAGAMLTLLSLAFFKGLSLSSRIAHDNAETLEAESLAWDAVWTAFNEDYDDLLAKSPVTRRVTLSGDAAPQLTRYNGPAELTVALSRFRMSVDGKAVDYVCVEGDVEWGPMNRRRKLSDTQRTFVYRGPLSRVEMFK